MDVTGWTIDQKMRLPDWCFGNRQVIGCYASHAVAASSLFAISAIPLPDPVCIWQMGYIVTYGVDGSGYARAGLADTIPLNTAQMNLADEIYPYFGNPLAGPNELPDQKGESVYVVVDFRRGMVTSGQYIVVQVYCTRVRIRLSFWLLVSGLPTDMAGWLEHSLI